ncbi:hypothetical protein [Variovorax sp.]|jgi:hypothetical protein|uniref:hypothetical protein n=1 Tax=Variovorax sp. TaxID=1871043 RepID=UPI0040378245
MGYLLGKPKRLPNLDIFPIWIRGVKMFFDALERISANEARAMAAHGVSPARISDWRKKRRLPTRAQALALATVMDLNFDQLERELTIIETKADAETNEGFATLLQKLKGQWHFS